MLLSQLAYMLLQHWHRCMYIHCSSKCAIICLEIRQSWSLCMIRWCCFFFAPELLLELYFHITSQRHWKTATEKHLHQHLSNDLHVILKFIFFLNTFHESWAVSVCMMPDDCLCQTYSTNTSHFLSCLTVCSLPDLQKTVDTHNDQYCVRLIETLSLCVMDQLFCVVFVNV